jgi:hypothetical protein
MQAQRRAEVRTMHTTMRGCMRRAKGGGGTRAGRPQAHAMTHTHTHTHTPVPRSTTPALPSRPVMPPVTALAAPPVSGLTRRSLPRWLVRVWELLGTALSPTATYSMPSRPKCRAPPAPRTTHHAPRTDNRPPSPNNPTTPPKHTHRHIEDGRATRVTLTLHLAQRAHTAATHAHAPHQLLKVHSPLPPAPESRLPELECPDAQWHMIADTHTTCHTHPHTCHTHTRTHFTDTSTAAKEACSPPLWLPALRSSKRNS